MEGKASYLREIVIHGFDGVCVIVAPYVADLGHLPEPGGGQIDTVQVGGMGNCFHVGISTELIPVGFQTLVELVTGILDSHAVQVAATAGRSGRDVRRVVGGGV